MTALWRMRACATEEAIFERKESFRLKDKVYRGESMNVVFFVLEIIGIVAFSLSGALTAMKKEMDIFGAGVLGMTTAIGGGIIRDLILGINPPTCFVNPLYAIIGFLLPMLTYIPKIQKLFTLNQHKTYDICLLIADSVGLGVFTIMGVNTCFEMISKPNCFTAIFLGVITGIGGGIFRDVFSLNLPKVFIKHFYACASILGALISFVTRLYLGSIISSILGIFVVISLRIAASLLHWKLPKPKFHFNQK